MERVKRLQGISQYHGGRRAAGWSSPMGIQVVSAARRCSWQPPSPNGAPLTTFRPTPHFRDRPGLNGGWKWLRVRRLGSQERRRDHQDAQGFNILWFHHLLGVLVVLHVWAISAGIAYFFRTRHFPDKFGRPNPPSPSCRSRKVGITCASLVPIGANLWPLEPVGLLVRPPADALK